MKTVWKSLRNVVQHNPGTTKNRRKHYASRTSAPRSSVYRSFTPSQRRTKESRKDKDEDDKVDRPQAALAVYRRSLLAVGDNGWVAKEEKLPGAAALPTPGQCDHLVC